jgi:hypothetical protein
MERVLPGFYLAAAIDIEPYRLAADTDLMERARAAAEPVDIRDTTVQLSLGLVRLRQLIQGP